MPEAQVLDENVDLEDELDEDVLEEEEDVLEEEETTTTTKKKVTRKRRLLAPANEYIFSSADDAKTALESDSLRYEDGSVVEGFRIWQIYKGVNEDNQKLVCCVLARSKADAACTYLESKDHVLDMYGKLTRGGRTKTKIPSDILFFGQTLATYIFEGSFPSKKGYPIGDPSTPQKTEVVPAMLSQWEQNFAAGGKYGHFIDRETNNWKDPTD